MDREVTALGCRIVGPWRQTWLPRVCGICTLPGASTPPAEGARIAWRDVPQDVRGAIERVCGAPVVAAWTQPGGFSPGVAARVRCADGTGWFVKAASAGLNPDTPRLHRREASVLADLDQLIAAGQLPVPRLRGTAELGPWFALVVDDVEGRQPTLPWQDGELDLVLGALDRLADALTPAPVPVPAVAEYLGTDFTGWRTLAGIPGDGVMVVDWPNACRGAAFTDLVFFAPSVAMQGGPEPAALLARSRAGRAASREALAAVVCALAGYFTERSLRPAPPGLPTVRRFQAAQAEVTRRWLATLL